MMFDVFQQQGNYMDYAIMSVRFVWIWKEAAEHLFSPEETEEIHEHMTSGSSLTSEFMFPLRPPARTEILL